MSLKTIAILAGLALAPVTAAQAQQQQMLPYDQDMQLQMALSEMYQASQMLCQSGNQMGCQGMQQVQYAASMLSQTSMACMQGNPQACQMYQQAYMQVSYDYNTFQTYVRQGQMQAQPQYAQPVSPQVQQQINDLNRQTNQYVFDLNQQTYQNTQNSLDNGHRAFIQSIWE